MGSAEVASTLELAIQHEQDLVADTSAFVAGDPDVSPADFDRWAEAAGRCTATPSCRTSGSSRWCRPRSLKAFEAHLAANPIRPLGPNSLGPKERFQILPAGRRPYYCFAIAGPGTHARDLPARRGRLLRPGPGADRRPRLRPGHLRARPRREQERARGPDPGLRAAAACPRPWRRDGGRSWAGSASCWNPRSCWRGRCRRTRTSPSASTTTRRARRSPSAAATGRRMRRRTTIDLHNGWSVQTFAPAPSAGDLRPLERAHDAPRRDPPEHRDRPARARARDRAQAGAVARAREDPRALREEPRARPPGAARPPHRAPQPRPRARPGRTADRAHRAPAGRRRRGPVHRRGRLQARQRQLRPRRRRPAAEDRRRTAAAAPSASRTRSGGSAATSSSC